VGDAGRFVVFLCRQALPDRRLTGAAEARAAPATDHHRRQGHRKTPALAARFADEFNTSLLDMETTAAQYARLAAACSSVGRDPGSVVLSTAQTVCVGRDDAEVKRRAALAGTVDEVVDRIGQWAERTGVQRIYLQLLDLSDLDHVELIAAEVGPQL
jgi:alkanesulfonate monooxygenase SsuD/methylene tetrahydromethanopterin reductase-like flavin-dependent oxidoreductase (luciferase family)